MDTVLERVPSRNTKRQHQVAKMLATLPMRLGGLWFAFSTTNGPRSLLGFMG